MVACCVLFLVFINHATHSLPIPMNNSCLISILGQLVLRNLTRTVCSSCSVLELVGSSGEVGTHEPPPSPPLSPPLSTNPLTLPLAALKEKLLGPVMAYKGPVWTPKVMASSCAGKIHMLFPFNNQSFASRSLCYLATPLFLVLSNVNLCSWGKRT